MSTSILKTKLFRPTLRPKLVDRQRLFERLDELLYRRLGLVCAPAGYGKTTLVAAWLQRVAARAVDQDVRVAWVSLDESDDDPGQFMAYLLAALQGVYGPIGAGVQSALTVRPLPPLEPMLVALLNELADRKAHCILVLDDYYLIQNARIHQAVDFFVGHLPPRLHVLLATRREPPLSLARLRIHGHLVELRRGDLAFTRPDADAFLGDVMGLSLDESEIATLVDRTEGWAAGLQLAALSLRGQDQDTRVARVDAFAGTDRQVSEFLLGEVLGDESGPVQAFLLRTSVLERMCAPLCDALVGEGASRAILDHLEEANLFLISLDQEHCWYRTHHLLRDYMRARLRSEAPEEAHELHRRASGWFERQGLYDEAAEHALMCGDGAGAARLVAMMAHGLANLREHGRLIGWFERLPDDSRLAHPWLVLHYAYALIRTGYPERGAMALEHVEMCAANDPAIAARLAAHKALVALEAGEHQQALSLAEAAIATLDGHPQEATVLETRADAHTVLGLCLREMREDINVRRQHFGTALDFYETIGHLAGTASSLAQMTVECLNLGQLHAGAEHCRRGLRQALQWATRHGQRMEPLQVTFPLHLQLAEIHYWWNDLEQARFHSDLAVESIELGQFSERRWVLVDVAALAQAAGDLDGARRALAKVEAMVHPSESVRWRIGTFVTRCRAVIARSHPNADDMRQQVAAWVDAHLPPTDGGFDEPDLLCRWALSAGLVTLGRCREALSWVVPLRRSALALGLAGIAIRAFSLEALARRALGEIEEGLDALGRALVLGRCEGFVRPFVDDGAPMKALLERFRATRCTSDLAGDDSAALRGYVERLLAAFPAQENGLSVAIGTRAVATGGLCEPLTLREGEVLELLASGLTNKRIAERLVVSAHTVGFHTRGIYGKLGVHTRGEAVAVARELGLI